MLALKSHDQAGKNKSASGAESSSTPQIKREPVFGLNGHEILKHTVNFFKYPGAESRENRRYSGV